MSEASAPPEIVATPSFAVAALPNDRTFAVGLVAATVLHALLFVSFAGSESRQLGDPGGAKDAISVDLISESDLRGLATVGEKSSGQPGPPPSPALSPPQSAPPVAASAPETPPAPRPEDQPPPAAPPPVPKAAPEPKEAASAKPALEPRKTEAAETAAPPEPQQSATAPSAVAKPEPDKPEAAKSEPAKSEPAKSEPAKQRPTKSEPTQIARLDLTPPAVFSAPSGGGGVERPAGITRSGENDAFGRGVIRALQRTMPQLRDTRGRVTVRVTLDMDGGLVSTQVVRPSNIAGLDQSVVFATRQSSFPFPPRNARSADLVFLITYIYR